MHLRGFKWHCSRIERNCAVGESRISQKISCAALFNWLIKRICIKSPLNKRRKAKKKTKFNKTQRSKKIKKTEKNLKFKTNRTKIKFNLFTFRQSVVLSALIACTLRKVIIHYGIWVKNKSLAISS